MSVHEVHEAPHRSWAPHQEAITSFTLSLADNGSLPVAYPKYQAQMAWSVSWFFLHQ
jgi:hypothetical protein